MTTHEAIIILTEANQWRRGADIEQPNPTDLGLAIDYAINKLYETIQ